jgi:hypothetical protein
VFAAFLAIGSIATSFGAEIPKAPVPPSPYLPMIYKFADTMIEHGRQTSKFLSALDRAALAPLTNRPAAPQGVRESDRLGQKGGALVGVSPAHDENLLRLLYTLSELSGKPKYRDAADAGLRWFVENADSPEKLFFRPWMLWERCFELAPEASKRFALGLQEHQSTVTSLREAGFYMRTWGVAYGHTTNEFFLDAIRALLTRFERTMSDAQTIRSNAWAASAPSLAVDGDAASRLVPEPLASRLRALANKEDEIFCSLPHDLKASGGFIIVNPMTISTERKTSLWSARVGGHTTAQVGMMCVSRYENTGRIAYRDLMHAAADAYLESLPEEGVDAWPATFGHAISLQLAAWRSTARQIYLDRARALADIAVKRFFDGSVLPRASLKTQHYESITGADTLALALVELHLHILHITAVRCPSNTIDR